MTRPQRPTVSKPRPKAQTKLATRYLEIEQLKKGYPSTAMNEDGSLGIVLVPSDPDFAFSIKQLQFSLHVPQNYPQSIPWIVVTNDDIPKGYSANVEIGFKEIATNHLSKLTLMNMTVQLDRHLEEFLKREKQDTIKIIKGKNKPQPKAASSGLPFRGMQGPVQQKDTQLNTSNMFVPAEFRKEREKEISLMKQRIHATLFSESEEKGSTFSIMISPLLSDASILPTQLCQPFRIKLHIPRKYAFAEACSITVSPQVELDISAEQCCRNIEMNFNRHSEKVGRKWSLLALLNYLTTQIESLILPPSDLKPVEDNMIEVSRGDEDEEVKLDDNVEDKDEQVIALLSKDLKEKVILSQEMQEVREEDTMNQKAVDIDSLPPLTLRGTALVLPGLKLRKIGVLECQILNLVVKCNKCKNVNDILNLASAPYGRESKPIGVSCCKCNAVLAVAFRKDLMHANNQRAGLLDFSGCTPFYMLPSTLVPTCEVCSTTLGSPFRKMEIGKTSYATCHDCHAKMSMNVLDYKFEVISDEGIAKDRLKMRQHKSTKENLGITGGTPLPDEGTCDHYKKSTRWFRFGCCSKVYPCDKCHHESSDHVNDRANRMICGKCSREQIFSDTCIYCRHSFIQSGPQLRSAGYFHKMHKRSSHDNREKSDLRFHY